MKHCVEVFKPLVKVLRLVDGDCRPSMPWVYGALKQAKNEIKNFYANVQDFEPILEIIETKVKGPLHVAGCMLNPYNYYQDKELQKDAACMNAVMTCIEKFFPDNYDLQDLVANVELVQYQKNGRAVWKEIGSHGQIQR